MLGRSDGSGENNLEESFQSSDPVEIMKQRFPESFGIMPKADADEMERIIDEEFGIQCMNEELHLLKHDETGMDSDWEKISKDPSKVLSPAWHELALRETESRIRRGLEEPLDWEKAKKELWKRYEDSREKKDKGTNHD